MKVYQRLAEAFKAEGVSKVFGMMGDGNMYWTEALDDIGVKLLEVRHEGVGCGMADGWARVTRTVGVCTATCGPGVTQLATALVTAARAQSPMVAFVGEHPWNNPGYIQYLDQPRFAAACETAFVRVNTPDNTDDAVRQAFHIAKTESRPVMLSAPMDVQQKSFDGDEPYLPTPVLAMSAAQPISPAPDRLKAAADIIAASRKPVIVAGRGAIWSGADQAIIKLGERTGALIATTLRAKGWPSNADYHVGISGHYTTRTVMELFEDADCVIAVGAGLNMFTIMGNLLYPNARYVQIDVKPQVLMGNSRFADCYVQADARTGVEAINDLLAQRSYKNAGYRTPEVRKSLVGHFQDRAEFQIEPGTLDPREICLAVDEAVPSEIPLASGSGASGSFTVMHCNRPRPMSPASYFFGCIGQMLPCMMGASVALGNKPLVLLDGDASTMMHLSDFDTAVRYNIPLLVVVLNDQALGSEYHKMTAHKMRAELSTIPTPDMGSVAVAFGGRGRFARTIDEVRAAVSEWVAEPGPMIVDAHISRNVLNIPYRRTLYARDE